MSLVRNDPPACVMGREPHGFVTNDSLKRSNHVHLLRLRDGLIRHEVAKQSPQMGFTSLNHRGPDGLFWISSTEPCWLNDWANPLPNCYQPAERLHFCAKLELRETTKKRSNGIANAGSDR